MGKASEPDQRTDAVGADAPPRLSAWTYLAIGIRYWRPVVLVPFIVATAMGGYAYSRPRAHIADAQFVVESSEAPSPLAQLTGRFGINLGTTSSKSPDYFAALLRSRELLRSLVEV